MRYPGRRTIDEDDLSDADIVPDVEKQHRGTERSSIESNFTPYSSSSSPSRDVSYGSHDSMLHHSPPKRRFSKSSYLYRIPNRTVRWLCIALMSTVILFILSLVRMSVTSSTRLEELVKMRPSAPAVWESFDFSKRYYGGLRTLVSKHQNIPEYPSENTTIATAAKAPVSSTIPLSFPIDPYPDYQSEAYKSEFGPVEECFLDSENKVKVARIHAYNGVPMGFPRSVMGSDELLGLSETSCYDRYGKLGPYGFGYSRNKGGVGAGIDGERQGADNVWKDAAQIDYSSVRWGEAQSRCLDKNKQRFSSAQPDEKQAFQDMTVTRSEENRSIQQNEDGAVHTTESSGQTKKTISRTAVVIRTWWDYHYDPESILYLRGLISELSLLTSAEYTVHFLIHVKDDNKPIWADSDMYQTVLNNALPEEFHGMGTLWSERQMGLIYGGLEESFYRKLPVHGVYRSAHLPLQYFAHRHPEYDYFWNWEMDTRYTGNWYKLFSSVRDWARDQPRKGLWERNNHFYVPAVHGTWEDFKQMVRVQSEMPPTPNPSKWANAGPPGTTPQEPVKEKPIWGPHPPLDVTPSPFDPQPPTTYEKDKYEWGVGEEADLITFNPTFDPDRTDWILAEDVTGYNKTLGLPPRRTAIITASRLSRRLLLTMHKETALDRHTMFSEMWPASCALHHGLKAVYAPHPVYIDRQWPLRYLAQIMNGGKNGGVGGARKTVFGDSVQHNLLGVNWHYNTGFAPNLWKRWLGYRVDGGGGEAEEVAGEGRMCLPGILLHPVKGMDLVVEGPRDPAQKDGA